MRALAFADGEGRNGVWLAEQGLDVVSIDGAAAAQQKAASLAAQRGVALHLEQADLLNWTPPAAPFDVVAAIFFQFAGPAGREKMFTSIKDSLKPGGLLLLEGYRPEQIGYGTGGPSAAENMYTEALLRSAFSDFEIIELKSYDAEVDEGKGHKGLSALIDLVARKPI
jgi:SAM-dependent methyltransferase